MYSFRSSVVYILRVCDFDLNNCSNERSPGGIHETGQIDCLFHALSLAAAGAALARSDLARLHLLLFAVCSLGL